MIVAVIGTGNVGSTLGTRWAQKGHQVVFGSRHPDSDPVRALLRSAGENACSASVAEAAAMGEVVVLAVPWSAARDVVRAAGNLEGKVVVDCTNPIASGLKGLSVEPGTSAAEQIAGWASGARVVKAFNSTGAGNMAHPDFDGQAATMFLSGDDEEAKKVVTQLAADLGFDVCDAGPLYTARFLESLALLWVHLAFAKGLGPDFAFKILTR